MEYKLRMSPPNSYKPCWAGTLLHKKHASLSSACALSEAKERFTDLDEKMNKDYWHNVAESWLISDAHK
eukprot:645116-Pelagomonas_calceolata.AAC.2